MPDPSHWLTLPSQLQWFTRQHLAELALVAAPMVAAVASLRVWAIRRALRRRMAYMVLPTDRTTYNLEKVDMFARLCAQMRLRRFNWWTRPANALRFRLDTVGGRGCVYSVGGPGWARGQLLTNSLTGMVLVRRGSVPLHLLTPKGMNIRPEGESQTSTGPAGWADDRTWPGEAGPERSSGL